MSSIDLIGDSSRPLTISEWRAVQEDGNGLKRLLSLVTAEQHANTETHAWISLASPEHIMEQWTDVEKLEASTPNLPLFGVPFAVKDNIDARGFVTTGACPAFAYEPASEDATVVANLKSAGAILIGKTNMDQFATGLVGTRSPHGAVPNSFDHTRVSGGSSSGSAVVVARGAVPFSLGTDTAGSGRIPAGLNNIIGLKPTRGALSTRGVLPACRTLDCVSIFSLTVDDAETVLRVAEGYDHQDSYSRSRPDTAASPPAASFGVGDAELPDSPSVAVCLDPQWYDRSDHYPAYEAALEKAQSLGWRLTPVDFGPLFALAQLLYQGPWVAERYQAIREFIERAPESEMDPTVRHIIMQAKTFSAADFFSAEYQRQDLARQIHETFRTFDAILVPTSPTFPTLEQLSLRPVEENSLLGTYTNFVNFLDWIALSVPAGFRPDGLPFGITLITNTWQESCLMELSKRWLSGAKRSLGATGSIKEEALHRFSSLEAPSTPASDLIAVAVVGAHLQGLPLNKDLISRGGTFVSSTATSANYRLFALASASGPPRPGLQRLVSPETGAEIEAEVWNLPAARFASFMLTIPSPLGIGSVELKDGSWVKGFICEPSGLHGATDITHHRSWRAYLQHRLSVESTSTDSGFLDRSIKTVLIANRGEISVRILRTLKRLGINSVTIHSIEDANAPHVRDADKSLRLDGDSVAETYLNGEQILRLAKAASVDAIIPGYGFLSENADFAAAVERAGIIWVGPTPSQISDLGLKHRARAIAAAAGVPVVPGNGQLLKSLDEARSDAQLIGFPLMLKSTAGGGGIGLVLCHDLDGLDAAFSGVQRLAAANFGDDGVFLERFVQNARHIEVQVLGDGTGRVITAGERDCSLQRRHQKVVEEGPAVAVPLVVREKMKHSATMIASAVNYRNVGTVEFIYDVDTQEFFFLEVNTRLQVEHPVTELVTGIDLVESMLDIAGGNAEKLFNNKHSNDLPMTGASVEVRVYAENPLQDFQPCAGEITGLKFPKTIRVDSWIELGTKVSTSYDPLLAKLIAHGRDREEALDKLAQGLAETEIHGLQTNLEYLKQLVNWPTYRSGEFTTKSLDSFRVLSSSVEILGPGASSTVQDFPGRVGYWNVGIPPSGPMDHLSSRLANRLVENPQDSAVIECTYQGPTLRFHNAFLVAIAGAAATISLDDRHVPINKAFTVRAGQVVKIGLVEKGYRVYVAIGGGIQLPRVMGSQATFEVGNFGGLEGRKLRRGDFLPLGASTSAELAPISEYTVVAPELPTPNEIGVPWTIGVVPGPHGAPEFFDEEGLKALFAGEWVVHHNSNRLGIRLSGPRPKWNRQSSGEAGLHPSNIHDSPYPVGGISFTGDEAVILTCDGPSLGGFLVFCVVASAEMWKVGQIRPGDKICLKPISTETSLSLDKQLTAAIDNLSRIPTLDDFPSQPVEQGRLLGEIYRLSHTIKALQAGERAILLEFGEEEAFRLRDNFLIRALCEHHRSHPIADITELSPGVRSVQVSYSPGISPSTVLNRLRDVIGSLGNETRVSSRKVRLPLAFDDSVSKAAIQRYMATIRPEAPWLPSNITFLEELNGLDDVSIVFSSATFLVLGLGDVFLGSPCAIPLDPRHRLFGTKYNPSRSSTPRGAVGIGGQYMCIYATESPGGYQLVGRTIDIWDQNKISLLDQDDQPSEARPWMFRLFDRISFYLVSEDTLDNTKPSDLIHIADGELDLLEYESWLEKENDDIKATVKRRREAIASAPFLDELRQPYNPASTLEAGARQWATDGFGHQGGETVKAIMPGRCFKVLVKPGDVVKKDDILVSL